MIVRCTGLLLMTALSVAHAQTPSDAGVQRYATHQSVAVQVKNPNPMSSSRWTTVRTSGWGLVDVMQSDEAVEYTETTCDIVTSKVFGTTTHYSPAFIASLGERERTGRMSGDTLVIGPYVQVLGAAQDADFLSQSADDAIDTDGDGFPGVTVSVKQAIMGEGDVYVGQRTTSVVRLTKDGAGWSGTIDSRVEEVVYDATTWWLKADREARPHPDASESTVEWVPVDPETTCDQVITRRDRLFDSAASR